MARSFISISAINRMISASNRRRKEEEREELINAQNGTRKEFPPTFSLVGVEFNSETRASKIEIEQAQKYRTVERYVTQNYQKYPIFSPWKIKTKSIKKTIKLTNAVLESLNRNEDPLIRTLAEEIVIALDSEDLQPSWFIKTFLEKEHKETINHISKETAEFCKAQRDKIQSLVEMNTVVQRDIEKQELELEQIRRKRTKILRKIECIESARGSFLLDFITLGIRPILHSSRRHTRLQRRLSTLDDELESGTDLIVKNTKSISFNEQTIKNLTQSIKDREKETRKKIDAEIVAFNAKVEEITPLPSSFIPDDAFIPLKAFVGMEYSKIVGCYIIRNREKNKYYVGQSKDVMKRIRQHFHGTMPNNIIFAEDYFSSTYPNKEDLFEFKIIPCETKDELDKTERDLIEQYDAFNSGYNGTNGNT